MYSAAVLIHLTQEKGDGVDYLELQKHEYRCESSPACHVVRSGPILIATPFELDASRAEQIQVQSDRSYLDYPVTTVCTSCWIFLFSYSSPVNLY